MTCSSRQIRLSARRPDAIASSARADYSGDSALKTGPWLVATMPTSRGKPGVRRSSTDHLTRFNCLPPGWTTCRHVHITFWVHQWRAFARPRPPGYCPARTRFWLNQHRTIRRWPCPIKEKPRAGQSPCPRYVRETPYADQYAATFSPPGQPDMLCRRNHHPHHAARMPKSGMGRRCLEAPWMTALSIP